VPDAPELRSPCALPHRPDEPGPILSFSVPSLDDGAPLPAPSSILATGQPGLLLPREHPEADAPYNLRGRVVCDGNGRFEVETRLSRELRDPEIGTTGVLLTGSAGTRGGRRIST